MLALFSYRGSTVSQSPPIAHPPLLSSPSFAGPSLLHPTTPAPAIVSSLSAPATIELINYPVLGFASIDCFQRPVAVADCLILGPTDCLRPWATLLSAVSTLILLGTSRASGDTSQASSPSPLRIPIHPHTSELIPTDCIPDSSCVHAQPSCCLSQHYEFDSCPREQARTALLLSNRTVPWRLRYAVPNCSIFLQ